jgi:Family of unknown function (DUF5681)
MLYIVVPKRRYVCPTTLGLALGNRMADKAAKKQRGRPFLKGVSGNPHGCARGSRHKASLLAERLMEGDAEEVVRAVVAAAKNGDMTAARIIIERLLPPKRTGQFPSLCQALHPLVTPQRLWGRSWPRLPRAM